ncbi:MAG: hypothetical protein JJE28_07885 [Actinomycetales bacterium]|nr:hypothetical protein [Actinomycetales bacterium]
MLIYVLLGSAVLTVVFGGWVDAAVILSVAVINAVIGFLQEGRAEKALDGIRRMLSLNAKSWLMPVKSWMTTTPGQGGGVLGTAQYVGMTPCSVRISTSDDVFMRPSVHRDAPSRKARG